MKKKDPKVTYDMVRDDMLETLIQAIPGSEEARSVVSDLKTLEEARSAGKSSKVSADTVVKAATTFATAGLLLMFERNNLITSKLLGFIPKIKL